MKELEYKFLVDKDFFNKAQEILKQKYKESSVNVIEQTNYYYDNDNLDLRKSGTTIRIRHKDGALKLQVKKHFKTGKRYSVCDEEERNIDMVYGSITVEDKRYDLKGVLHTRRTRYVINDGIRVEFDVSSYLGHEDYEIEIEFFMEQIDEVKKLIEVLGLPTDKKGKGKASRFFEALKNMRDRNYDMTKPKDN
ncbi:MAG: CYTH domain-containing protein [Clostridiaceae bacterium]|nr:CYTH domain-containing protein [Clostridiaceae bacterium]